MKTIIFTLLISIFTLVNVQSQTYFGAKVGMNLSGILGNVENTKPQFGAHAGLFAEINVSDLFAVQPELLFSMKGYGDKDDTEFNYLYNFKYIDLNIMAKYRIRDYITIDLGPQIAYLIDANFSTGEDVLTSVSDDRNKFDFGVGLGGSYEFDDWLIASIRYNVGFMNVFKTDTDVKGINSVLQISAGYKF